MERYLIDTNIVDYFLMDAIIAATALANNMILLTANERDFSNIDGLNIINPRTL